MLIMHGTSVYQCFAEICNISNLEICLVFMVIVHHCGL